jgi:hypothetical protein
MGTTPALRREGPVARPLVAGPTDSPHSRAQVAPFVGLSDVAVRTLLLGMTHQADVVIKDNRGASQRSETMLPMCI